MASKFFTLFLLKQLLPNKFYFPISTQVDGKEDYGEETEDNGEETEDNGKEMEDNGKETEDNGEEAEGNKEGRAGQGQTVRKREQ